MGIDIFLQRRYIGLQQAHEKIFNITNHQRNANQNNNEIDISSCLSEWLSSKNLQITSVGEDVDKREP